MPGWVVLALLTLVGPAFLFVDGEVDGLHLDGRNVPLRQREKEKRAVIDCGTSSLPLPNNANKFNEHNSLTIGFLLLLLLVWWVFEREERNHIKIGLFARDSNLISPELKKSDNFHIEREEGGAEMKGRCDIYFYNLPHILAHLLLLLPF